MQEEYPGQRHTAYHEAGHAIAAIKTPGGAVEHIDICDPAKDPVENGGTNCSSPDADDAFRVYGGPWAHLKFYRPTEALTFHQVLTCIYNNDHDQVAFLDFADRDALIDTEETILEWHDRADGVMSAAWQAHEVQDLAEEMLARKKEIQLSNGQLLVRDTSRDRWVDKNYVEAPREGRGLVGPLPEFIH